MESRGRKRPPPSLKIGKESVWVILEVDVLASDIAVYCYKRYFEAIVIFEC